MEKELTRQRFFLLMELLLVLANKGLGITAAQNVGRQSIGSQYGCVNIQGSGEGEYKYSNKASVLIPFPWTDPSLFLGPF
jgi:hypothetical protein